MPGRFSIGIATVVMLVAAAAEHRLALLQRRGQALRRPALDQRARVAGRQGPAGPVVSFLPARTFTASTSWLHGKQTESPEHAVKSGSTRSKPTGTTYSEQVRRALRLERGPAASGRADARHLSAPGCAIGPPPMPTSVVTHVHEWQRNRTNSPDARRRSAVSASSASCRNRPRSMAKPAVGWPNSSRWSATTTPRSKGC